MTAAGQAMVVLVPIRPKSAMTFVNDKDAELMGLVDEEKERLAQVDKDKQKEMQLKASDLADLRAARKELKRSRQEEEHARKEALEARLKAKPEKGAPAIPSFLKVKAAKSKDAQKDQDAGEDAPDPAEPDAKRARIEAPVEAAGAPSGLGGLGSYASDSEDEVESSEDEAT
ncbi:unnamed protein product [Symbiodinium sp. CCMP2592]|nr:unnamed protein product [Symbiodinium sp. CCMP2592]